MRKYFVLTFLIMFFTFQGVLFAFEKLAPKNSHIYIEGNIKNLDTIIKSLGKKLYPNQDLFEKNYKTFKRKMLRDLDGVDLTDSNSLKSIGVDVNRRSGFVMAKVDMFKPEFFIAIAANDVILAKDFFTKLYRKNNSETKSRDENYNGYSINIIQRKSYPDEYKDDFVTVAVEKYFLISNSLDPVKIAIDAYRSGNNLSNNPDFKKLSTSLDREKQFSFIFVSGELIDLAQNMMTMFSGTNSSSGLKGLYKSFGFAIELTDKNLSIKCTAIINKTHQNYNIIKDIYNPKSDNINLFNYLPAKPYSFIKISFNAKKFFDSLQTLYPDIAKELDSEIENIKKETSFDLKANLINNLGNNYSFVLYDFDKSVFNIINENSFNNLDFLAYAEVKNEKTLDSSIKLILDIIKKQEESQKIPAIEPSKPGQSPSEMISKENIGGVQFYKLTDGKQINIYFGAYKNHFIVASRKKRLEELINNVRQNKKQFASSISHSELKNIVNNLSNSQLVIDFDAMVKAKKFPSGWLKYINLNKIKYFYMYYSEADGEYKVVFSLNLS